jgi:hypothetical protein
MEFRERLVLRLVLRLAWSGGPTKSGLVDMLATLWLLHFKIEFDTMVKLEKQRKTSPSSNDNNVRPGWADTL